MLSQTSGRPSALKSLDAFYSGVSSVSFPKWIDNLEANLRQVRGRVCLGSEVALPTSYLALYADLALTGSVFGDFPWLRLGGPGHRPLHSLQ